MKEEILFTNTEAIFAVIASFCAAFNLALALSSGKIDSKEDNSSTFFFLAILSLSFYCVSEGLVYSKSFSEEYFFIASTGFIAIFMVSAYLWMRSLTQKTKIRRADLLLYLFSVPGVLLSIQSYFLPVSVKREIYNQYLYGFNHQAMVNITAKNQVSLLPIYSSGLIHVILIAGFLSLIALLTYRNKLSKDSESEYKLLKTLYVGFFSLIINAFLALVVPALLKVENLAGYNPIFTLPVSAIFFLLIRQKQQLIEKAVEHRNLMSKYLPRELVNKVMVDNLGSEEGSKNEAVILFSDIRGFTEISESIPPEAIVSLLNSYFTVMNKVIQKHGGVISKYIGDAIMVVFSDDDEASTMYDRSSLCALEMMEALEDFNKRATRNADITLEIGIAIHSGEMIHGSVGCSTRMEYTVIGDTVNTAARLANLNADLKKSILCSQEYLNKIHFKPENVNLEGDWVFKGKSEAISVYSFGQYLENGQRFQDKKEFIA